MRKMRVVLGVMALSAAVSLIPSAGAQAADFPTTTCTTSGTLQLGLLGAAIPSRPSCATPPIACPAGQCAYQTTATIVNSISVSSGVTATVLGTDHNGEVSATSSSCPGGVTCTAVASALVGRPDGEGGGAGARGICTWQGGNLVALTLSYRITCTLQRVNVFIAPQ